MPQSADNPHESDAELPADEENASTGADADWSPFAANADAEQIDAMYRQVLDSMEAVEIQAEIATADDAVDDEITEPPDATAADDVVTQPASHDAPTSATSGFDRLDEAQDRNRVSPAKIVEAALFVGGTQLTAKKLRKLLGGDYPADFVDQTIENLNRQYNEERRPYEILFGEGGYRMALKSEFDRVRNRAFGVGPKEIRLTQEALETLSLVAYRQPVTPGEIDKLRGQPTAGTLRQLIRRELIALERDPENRKHVEYHTTPRFLQLFGLSHINELPQADDLNFK